MNKYVIVSFLEDSSQEQIFSKSEWLLHLTIVRPFSSKKEDNYFIEALESICSQKNKIQLIAISEELFGENKDIPVTELENTQEIQNLHNEIMEVLKDSIEFEFSPYENYRPHVTKQGVKKIEKGQQVHIDNISLVGLNGDSRQILGTFFLKN